MYQAKYKHCSFLLNVLAYYMYISILIFYAMGKLVIFTVGTFILSLSL